MESHVFADTATWLSVSAAARTTTTLHHTGRVFREEIAVFTTITVSGEARGLAFTLARQAFDAGNKVAKVEEDVKISEGPDGFNIEFGRRVLRMPSWLKDANIVRVFIKHTFYTPDDAGAPAEHVNERVLRKRSTASVTAGGGGVHYLWVEGATLGVVNRLYEDVLFGDAIWR